MVRNRCARASPYPQAVSRHQNCEIDEDADNVLQQGTGDLLHHEIEQLSELIGALGNPQE